MYYRYMDPRPQSFNHQIPPPPPPPHSHPGHYHPFWEAMPPPTNIDLHHPSGFGHLPCPNPAEHSGCCNYSYPPGYHSFRPAYSCIPPPLYYHTPYAPHPDSYPAYSIPPPHYSLDQPRYDYDKARHHCCGCPNHSCHQKDDRSVKIEEQQDPEEEHNRGSSSLIHSPNHNFPILWVPPEYMKGKENLNGWVPIDINSLKGTKPEGEEKKQLPSPVIWMPSYDKPKEAAKDVKEINPTPKSVEEWPSKFKIIPLKFLENGDKDKKPRIVEDDTKSGVQPEAPAEKESSRTKNIPVKHLEDGDQDKKPRIVEDEAKSGVQPKAPAEKESSRTKNIPVKHLEERNQKKTSTPEKREGKEENEAKKASENKSKVKSSKLPPVCLRVDPLPRKKMTNGNSRSTSPAELEAGGAHQQNERKISKEPREEIAKEKDVPVRDMKGDTASQEAKEEKCQVSVPASSGVAVVEEACKNDNLQAKQEVLDMSEHPATEQRAEFLERNCSERDQEAADKEQKMEGKKERRLSELDAAVIIQSAYRGFEVRRWQPLEKLRKIAKIREQMLSIRRQIESTEAFTKEKDAKQRVVISETIMNLLLQLDTIQGLHPTVREVRKAVARELVCLEEKLDSLDSLVAEDHESVKAKTNVHDENSEDHLSCPETKSTTKQEGLEEMVASVGCMGTSERAKVEDLSPDDGVVFNPNPSSVSNLTTERETKQPTEVDSNVEHPPFESEESNRSVDDGVAIIASPSLVTVQVPEEKLQIAADGNGSLDQPILNDNEAEYYQEMDEGKRAQEAEVEVEKSHIEDDGNGLPEQQILDNNEAESCQEVDEGKKAEEVEAVETTAEEASEEASIFSGSITNMPLKEDGSSNASAYEENVSPGVNGRFQEVYGEEHVGAEEESVDSGGSDNQNIIHESEELPLQASGEESNISKDAPVRVEEANAELRLLIAPAEGETDRNVDKPPEFKEDAYAEDDLQVLSMVGGDCQSEMSAELECVAGLDSCPEDADGGDNIVATAADKSGMLAAEYGTNPPEEEPECGVGNGSSVDCEGNKDPTSGDCQNNVVEPLASARAFDKEASPVVVDDTSLSGPVLEATSGATEAPVLAERGAVDDLPVGVSAEKKLIEENEKLREMLEKLLEAGKEQVGVISSLNGRVKDLERKLAQKKRVKVKRNRAANKIHP